MYWDRSKSGFPRVLAQRCFKRRGSFLLFEEYDGKERCGTVLVLEGHGKGWYRFISGLQIAVNFFQPCLAKNLGVKKRRSFSEVLSATISPTEEPYATSSEPLARVPKSLAVNNSQASLQVPEKMTGVSLAPATLPAKPTQFPAHACGPPPHVKTATQRISVLANLYIPDTSVGPFGVFDRANLRMLLEALQLEIGRCL